MFSVSLWFVPGSNGRKNDLKPESDQRGKSPDPPGPTAPGTGGRRAGDLTKENSSLPSSEGDGASNRPQLRASPDTCRRGGHASPHGNNPGKQFPPRLTGSQSEIVNRDSEIGPLGPKQSY